MRSASSPVTVGLANGDLTLLPVLPGRTGIRPIAPQRADNGTGLLPAGAGPMLLTWAADPIRLSARLSFAQRLDTMRLPFR